MDDYNQSASERQHSIRHDVEIIREDNETEEKDWIQEELWERCQPIKVRKVDSNTVEWLYKKR